MSAAPVACSWALTNRGVVLSPLLDHDLCFIQAVEDFSVEQFVA